MVSKGFPNVTTSGRQYNFGEKPSVILYTYINLHAGTPKPQSFLSKSPGLQCSIGSERELYKYINHYSVVTKACMVSRCTVDTSLLKVAIRYIQYIAYTVLIEMMQIVSEDLYTWP